MDAFLIEGGTPLNGSVAVNGSKNASLPILAAALLTDDPITIHDIPDLADIANLKRLLTELGTDITEQPGSLTLHTTDTSNSHARYDIVKTMRASICVLGPLLAKRGFARVSLPGGCAIGDRPVDLHLRGLEALGAHISVEAGDIIATTPRQGLIGTKLFLGGPNGPTVLGTANVMCAATLAKGTTIIEAAACEPEVADLAKLLTAMGAHISGAGTPRITIQGVPSLHTATHTVIPDRIEAATLMIAAAISQGRVTVQNCPVDALLAVIDMLTRAGVAIQPSDPAANITDVTVTTRGPLRPVQITTQPHPGFPTDVQAQTMALLSLAAGNSVITERIFPERFLHVAELARMGAQLYRQASTVVVSGVPELRGAPVMASDLRASASLVLAAIAAQGATTISRVYHLDRGYEQLETRLNAIGANIQRVDQRAVSPVAAL